MKVLWAIVAVSLFCYVCFADEEETPEPSNIREVSSLDDLVNTDDGQETLEAEFDSIKGGQRKPWTVASLPENIKKNRYEDLLAYDENRVVLELLPDDPNSDYINANYIDGWDGKEKEYVATQGPLPSTVNDFWRMIWQLNATKIVMLANVFEHGKMKVAKYWPESKAAYGDIKVTKICEYSIPRLQHVIRTFYLEKAGITTPRLVRQFHFTGWPDLGVPTDRLPVVSLLQQVRSYKPEHKAPTVIHCSAGIGRTGTIILLDSMMQKAKEENVVDFPKRLNHMRLQRPDLVEKKAQYIFAHQAINDVFNVPETEAQLKKVEEEYKHMDNIMNSDNYRPAKDLRSGLQRLKWQSNLITLLVNSLLEKSTETQTTNEI